MQPALAGTERLRSGIGFLTPVALQFWSGHTSIMAAPNLVYPVTRYDPPLVDLADAAERERLSPAAARAFFKIVARWQVRDEDARTLLGGISNGRYYEWKKEAPRTLGVDTLLRISYLLGIFEALHVLHSESLADEWVRLPNTNRIFGGQTPLGYMLGGGVPAMQTVRRLLDARRGGL